MQSQQNPSFRSKVPGHFSRLFPELDPLVVSELDLKKLALYMKEWDAFEKNDSTTIVIGMAIFSQFLAHDITFEVTSSFDKSQAIHQFRNERTINFDLDCVYGQRNQSFYYDKEDEAKLLLGKTYREHGYEWIDLQRNNQKIAIIPDARNDENIIVSGIQSLMIQFHNKVVDYLRAYGESEDIFTKARKLVTWHYHWLIVHEYLSRMMDPDIFKKLSGKGSKYYTQPHSLPLEFSGAAFRVGHSQSPDRIKINKHTNKGLFELGFFTIMDEHIDWRYIFDFENGMVQFAKKLDVNIAPAFHDIPFIKNVADPFEKSLPYRNMLRGVLYGLPSGEAVAQRLGFEALEVRETHFLGLDGTPLWYYILKEAEEIHDGECLGPVGSTILGECFFTILRNDDWSYLKLHPKWQPILTHREGKFDFTDLISFLEDDTF